MGAHPYTVTVTVVNLSHALCRHSQRITWWPTACKGCCGRTRWFWRRIGWSALPAQVQNMYSVFRLDWRIFIFGSNREQDFWQNPEDFYWERQGSCGGFFILDGIFTSENHFSNHFSMGSHSIKSNPSIQMKIAVIQSTPFPPFLPAGTARRQRYFYSIFARRESHPKYFGGATGLLLHLGVVLVATPLFVLFKYASVLFRFTLSFWFRFCFCCDRLR